MKIIRFVLLTLAIAALTHVGLLYFGPSLVMGRVLARMTEGRDYNTMASQARPTAENNKVVRSSPDLLYSACPYDVSEHAVSIRADVPPDTYWSMAFYDANTNNYRVINDGEASAGAVVIVLRRAGDSSPPPAGAEVIASPTDRGLVLIRTLVAREARLPEIDEARRKADCKPL